MLPHLWQYEKGWCIKRESIKEFFKENMKNCYFAENEINDFTDCWIPLLKEFNYYSIYPQFTSHVDLVIKLNFSIQPDNIYRLFMD